MVARNPRVLIRVDDAALRTKLQDCLAEMGTISIACSTDAELLAQIEAARPKIFCSQFDSRRPADVLRIKLVMNLFPRLTILLFGSNNGATMADQTRPEDTLHEHDFLHRVTAFIAQPWHPHDIARSVSTALCPDTFNDRHPAPIDPFLIGRSQEMQQVSDAIARLAENSLPILIQGEHGTGKRLTALAMHSRSRHLSLSIHTLDCDELGSEHLAKLLFGPPKSPQLPPMLDDPRIGTIVLGELAAISPAIQSKLIDWIRKRPPYATAPRIIFTTSRDLGRLVANRKVRADLFLELSNQVIGLPPLRHRRGDIRLLVDYFAQHLNDYLKGLQMPLLNVTETLYKKLESHSWPFNVRELRTMLVATALRQTPHDLPAVDYLEQLLANSDEISDDRQQLSTDSVITSNRSIADEIDAVSEPRNDAPHAKPDETLQYFPQPPSQDNQQYWALMVERFAADESPNIYARALEMFEKELLTRVLDRTGGNIQDSARLLGMTNLSLKKKIQHLEIKVPEINA